MRILLVEDEPEMAALIAAALIEIGFAVDSVPTRRAATEALRLATYSLVILDRCLPDGDSLPLITTVRSHSPGTPMLVVSALDAVPDRVAGLNAGVDDYLPKPFDISELRARVRAALRRGGAVAQPSVTCGRLRFDLDARTATVAGLPMVLKRRELGLLAALVTRAGRVVQRARLIDEVYGLEEEFQSNTLDAHVSRLRARLVSVNAGVQIHPVRGVGYILDEEKT